MNVVMSRSFWMLFRQAFLLLVDAVERELDISPRTAELRRLVKNQGVGASYRADVGREEE